jgi:hypothetical protein
MIDFGFTKISDVGFEISDLPAVSPVFKSEIVHPKSEILKIRNKE